MAARPVFVTFDGPKAVGKSTLIGLLGPSLAAAGARVRTVVEKEVIPDPVSRRLETLYAAFRREPGPETDRAVAAALLEARILITRDVLAAIDADLVLLDRWYPSDAVFRRFLDPSEVVGANLSAGVLVPDLVLAVTCDPATSWERAMARGRGLDSKVVSGFADHEESTRRFAAAAETFGWEVVRTDAAGPRELASFIADRLRRLAGHGRAS